MSPLPFLKIGVTLANFHSSGKIPVSIDLAKISVRDGETMLEAIFNSLFGIFSLVRPTSSHLVWTTAYKLHSVMVLSMRILISEIFPALFDRREDSSLIKYKVFLGFDLLSSRLSMKYLRLAFLISLCVWFRARLY